MARNFSLREAEPLNKHSQAIHKISARAPGKFVAIDCGAIPANLIESELFGHVKGAFTGATHERKGLIEEANHGTLFMDEIVNLPLDMQSKLMRVLQENEIRPVGSNKTRKIDVRVITAASFSLNEMVTNQLFREDLFYRLYVYPIIVPTLAERREDIPLLANHFLKKCANKQHKKARMFHSELLGFMNNRKWAGNIRELENFVERVVTLAPPEITILGNDVLPENLKKELKKNQSTHNYPTLKSLNESVAEHEEHLIRQALTAHDWNQSQAARALKIPLPTLQYKMKKLGVEKPQ